MDGDTEANVVLWQQLSLQNLFSIADVSIPLPGNFFIFKNNCNISVGNS